MTGFNQAVFSWLFKKLFHFFELHFVLAPEILYDSSWFWLKLCPFTKSSTCYSDKFWKKAFSTNISHVLLENGEFEELKLFCTITGKLQEENAAGRGISTSVFVKVS